MIVLGLVVNPKLKVPVLVTFNTGAIEIWALNGDGWSVIGKGYYSEVVSNTGLMRANTPAGVRPKNMGYGTCLYTALCLGAHQNAKGRAQIDRFEDGDGVASETEDRSCEAALWWHSAAELGLVGEHAEETSVEDIDFRGEGECLVGEDIGGLDGNTGTVTHVNYVNVDYEQVTEVHTYEYSSAEDNHLILAAMAVEVDAMEDESIEGGTLESLWKTIRDDPFVIDETNLELLLALDVTELSEWGMNLVGILAQDSGASATQLGDLHFRWRYKLDPSEKLSQMSFEFRPNSKEFQDAVHVNERTEELREKTAWSDLANLP